MNKLGFKSNVWVSLLVLAFVGQLAWGIENQFYNTFLYDKITPDPRAVSWMVAITAAVSTVTALLMGTFSDRTRTRWGKRRPFLFIGYILWGVFTASFPAAAQFHPVALGVFMAILLDSVMTFFGATANDAAFSAYIADITTQENRGRVTGALEIMKWIAFLIVYGGAGAIIQYLGYPIFFITIGILVFLAGIIFPPQLPREPEGEISGLGFWRDIADTFRLSTLKANRNLFLVLISLTLFMFAFNIFFPFIMIYLNHYIKLEMLQSSLLIAIAILIGGVGMAYPIGLLADRWGRRQVAVLSVVVESVGLLLFSLTKSFVPLVITGIIWLAAFTAWTVATNAWTKDLYPEDKRGQFAGFYILFNVAFTMIPGPLLGGWLASQYGIPTVLDGKAGTIPTPLIFQVAAVVVLLTLIPLFFIRQDKQAQR
jgi:MFS family permease